VHRWGKACRLLRSTPDVSLGLDPVATELLVVTQWWCPSRCGFPLFTQLGVLALIADYDDLTLLLVVGHVDIRPTVALCCR